MALVGLGHRPRRPAARPTCYYWQGPSARTASPSATAPARAGYTFLENKYYLDHLYTDIIVGCIREPIARAAYWFNQNVIDGVVNARRRRRPATAARPSTGTSTRAGRRRRQRQRPAARRRRARSCGAIQTGKVQQYGALLFGGAAVLAAVFVIVI